VTTGFVHEVTNTASVGSVRYMNVMHFMFPGAVGPTTAELNALITKIKTGFYTLLSSYMPTGSNWTAGAKVTVFDKHTPALKVAVPATSAIDFSATGTATVSQLACCVNWHTATPGRSSTGRTFIGPLNSTAISGAYLSSGFQGSVASVCSSFPGGVAALPAPFWFGVYSKHDLEFYPITGGSFDQLVDTLRSRKT
jgi:hypothetical protein